MGNKIPRIPRSITFFIAIIALIFFNLPKISSTGAEWSDLDWGAILTYLNKTKIENHIWALSSLPSRVTGYEGAEIAASYIESAFKNYGLVTSIEPYFITTPIDMGANISIMTEKGEILKVIKAYTMWPNVVNPSPYSSPPEGDIIIYGGYASLSELTDFARKFNTTVEGKIVLLEFNCRWYWKNAVLLGAKAVIFIGPDDTIRSQAEQKTMSIPLNFPRLYVNREDGLILKELLLREGPMRVRVSSFMKWVRKPTVNVIGFLEGEDQILKREIVAITAYYDSWSPVPALAPGATDALNPAFLLEFARLITEAPGLPRPKRSVLIIAFSGHYQGIWGAREFINKHFFEIGTKIKLFLSVDLATESRQLALYHTGNTYSYTTPSSLQARFYWARDAVFSRYQPSMEKALGKRYETVDGIVLMKPPYEYPPLIFDSDVFTLACYGGGLAFRTTNAIRIWQKTPLDLPDKLNMENLWPQIEFLSAVFYAFLNDPIISSFITLSPSKLATDWGFARVIGQISLYNMTSAWFDPVVVDDVVVRVVQLSTPLSIPGVLSQAIPQYATTTSGVGFVPSYPGAPLAPIDIVMIPDENGTVKFAGAKPFTHGLMMAYVINSTNGRIEQVMDLGVYGYRDQYSPQAPSPTTPMFYVYSSEIFRYLPLYKTSSIALLNVLNPQTLMPVPEGAVEIYNFISHGWQIQHAQDVFWPEIMVYCEPCTPTEIVIRTGEKSASAGFYYPLVILNNASKTSKSAGYILQQGDTLILTPFDIVRDFLLFNDYRVSILHTFNTFDPRLEDFYIGSISQYHRLQSSINNVEYGEAYSSAMTAWVYTKMTYASSMDIIIDVVLVTVIFFFTLIPYSFMLEKLMFSYIGLKRIICIICLFVIVIFLLNLVHPGFHIATNVPMVLIALAIITIAAPVTIFVFSEAQQIAKELRGQTMGTHFAEISRASILLTAFSVGIQNMKRRKFRTVLMVLSITLTCFSLVALTTISSISVMRTEEKTVHRLPYSGFLVRLIPWTPIPELMVQSIEGNYSNADVIVAPRSWIYPPRQELEVALGVIVKAILAMSPREDSITPVRDFITQGRWFSENDYRHVIVSESLADQITNATGKFFGVGSRLNIYGLDLTVVGLMDGSRLWNGIEGLVDLDGEAITPMDTMAAATEAGQAASVVSHILGDYVIIIPYRLALEAFNALPISVAVKLPQDKVVPYASAFSKTVLTDVFAGLQLDGGGRIIIYRPRLGYSSAGITMLIVPLCIAAFALLNMMLGSVYERVREIGIYSSLGLAPLHVSGMFFSESVLYAVIGGIAGYLIGIYGIATLNFFKLLPEGFYPNFSSSFVIIALGMSSVVVISSTAYPALKASKLVTPYVERKIQMTKPIGDEWNSPLPFFAADEEIGGVIAFMKEYFDTHSVEGVGTFIATDVKVRKEVKDNGEQAIILSSEIWLEPLDAGITEDVMLIALSQKPQERYNFSIYAKRKTGLYTGWLSSHRVFIENVREQLLIWRTLRSNDKMRYQKRSKELFQNSR